MINGILKKLKETSGSNDKIAVLREYDCDDLRTFFQMSLSPLVNYYQKKIPEYNPKPVISLAQAFDRLKTLSNRLYTGHAAIGYLQEEILGKLSADNAAVIEKILKKNPDCGVSVGLVNKAFGKDFIKKFPISKAYPYNIKNAKSLKFPCLVQIKLDGGRCQVKVINNTLTFYSSSGKELNMHGVFNDSIFSSVFKNCVLDGELLAVKDGKVLPRKIGNGILTKAVRNTITPEEAKCLKLVLFDIIPLSDWMNGESEVPYDRRFKDLKLLFSYNKHKNIEVVHTEEANTIEEVKEIFWKFYRNGEEGVIAKNKDMRWKSGRTKDMLKFKGILTADLEVVNVIPGTGKYEGMIGSLLCATSDRKLVTSVGSGLSDEDRKQSPAYFMNRIIEVEYNEVIKSKQSESSYSLFLPRFIQVREDKVTADNFEELKHDGKDM